MQPDKLFVYGTLRRGYSLDKHLGGPSSRFLGRGTIRGRLYDLGDFPGAIPTSSPGEKVAGEIYELVDPESQLRELDQIEEFDPSRPDQSLFVRRVAEVVLDNGREVKAWIYFLPKPPEAADLIPGGDYAQARRRRAS